MQAKIAYKVEFLNYGDDNERNGWYIIRLTICNGAFIERKPVARFDCDSHLENPMNARDFSDYCKAGHHVAHKDLLGTDAYLKL
jgi:hypothetical protein